MGSGRYIECGVVDLSTGSDSFYRLADVDISPSRPSAGERLFRQGSGSPELGVDAPADGAEKGEVPGRQFEAEHFRTVGPACCLA